MPCSRTGARTTLRQSSIGNVFLMEYESVLILTFPSLYRYAAEDAISHLLCYLELQKKPDLTRRLAQCDATPGTKVDIVPRNGSIACMATQGASGVIEEAAKVHLPDGIKPKS